MEIAWLQFERRFRHRRSPPWVWERIRDVGALHRRLVPGFVLDTRLEGARWVTFANGMVVKEPIVTIDDEHRRLVWSAESAQTQGRKCTRRTQALLV
jgi:hypothetical protein